MRRRPGRRGVCQYLPALFGDRERGGWRRAPQEAAGRLREGSGESLQRWIFSRSCEKHVHLSADKRCTGASSERLHLALCYFQLYISVSKTRIRPRFLSDALNQFWHRTALHTESQWLTVEYQAAGVTERDEGPLSFAFSMYGPSKMAGALQHGTLRQDQRKAVKGGHGPNRIYTGVKPDPEAECNRLEGNHLRKLMARGVGRNHSSQYFRSGCK
ncbi:uncharacterized protein LOC128912341 [Rissa tridactyla]|uniref:uncharacterized protein LOC128912341 n=1 Tax=Rissa tridactyla TaxID=75485 RepID=UPI0023BA8837|nr:uncharacterized protein LOC128912341 [Rissa tridactyla]